MTENHTFETFSARCSLCKNIEIIKNPECTHIIHDVDHMDEETKIKMKKYGIKAVPTIVVDGKYKIVGRPDFSIRCSKELFKKLEKDYHLD